MRSVSLRYMSRMTTCATTATRVLLTECVQGFVHLYRVCRVGANSRGIPLDISRLIISIAAGPRSVRSSRWRTAGQLIKLDRVSQLVIAARPV